MMNFGRQGFGMESKREADDIILLLATQFSGRTYVQLRLLLLHFHCISAAPFPNNFYSFGCKTRADQIGCLFYATQGCKVKKQYLKWKKRKTERGHSAWKSSCMEFTAAGTQAAGFS